MDESQRRLDQSVLRQAYRHVEKAGPRGLNQSILGNLLAVPALQARSICRQLLKRKLVKTAPIDRGRQRINQLVY